jgi:hypothetical protein
LNKTRLGFPKLSVLSALLIPVAAMAAPFTNGGFESPGIAVGISAPIAPGVNEPTGWTAGGTASPGSFSLFYQNSAFFPGGNSVGFGGNGTTGASISQTFNTVAGQSYAVNYQATQQQGSSDQSFQAAAFNGTNFASPLASVSFAIPFLVGSETFHYYAGPTLTFTAIGTDSTIRFLDLTTTGTSAANWSLDNVTVNGAVTAVPEPETYALMLAGLGLMGFIARKKKASALA